MRCSIHGIAFIAVYLGMLCVVFLAKFPDPGIRLSTDYLSSFEFLSTLAQAFMAPYAFLPSVLGQSGRACVSLGISAALVVVSVFLTAHLLYWLYRWAVRSLSPS